MVAGHGWGAAEEPQAEGGYGDSPVSFEGGAADHTGYALSEGDDEHFVPEANLAGY